MTNVESEIFIESLIDDLANEASTSLINDYPQPSENQKKSGNYKKGHLRFKGLPIAVENPAGSFRCGTDQDGKPWKSLLHHHYGYIKQTLASDGDPIDVFIGPNHDSENVYIVNQKNKDGKFDEVKVMLGFDNIKDALHGYLQNYEKDWVDNRMIGSVEEANISSLKDWLKNGNLKKQYINKI